MTEWAGLFSGQIDNRRGFVLFRCNTATPESAVFRYQNATREQLNHSRFIWLALNGLIAII